MHDNSHRKPLVVHVSGDFPDPIKKFKTPVIRSLLELTADNFDHQVFSINRSSPGVVRMLQSSWLHRKALKLEVTSEPFDYGTALEYKAPGRGIFHATMLRQLGDWIARRISGGPIPDLLVGHKLTIEGIAVARAAALLNIPYAITIQGNTDARILEMRPDLRKDLKAVFHGAAAVVPFTPWALAAVEELLGQRTKPTFVVPCPTDMDQIVAPQNDGDTLLTVFNLWNHRGKNLHGMVEAVKRLEKTGRRVSLAVVGGGTPAELAQCHDLAKGFNGIVFEGPLDRSSVQKRMRSAKGLILPSLRESFGLVFTEALMAGLPIVYPSGTAVDGYFDGLPFAIAVDARDPDAIARAMTRLVDEEAELKRRLLDWQGTPDARRFTRPAIAKQYSAALLSALDSQ
ncbi:glycosyltransferase involved in cell wall biosynthesis [Novosphingobium hassiacum]|uniref:Glycosyltransferase involved in cell wall biosynthesis n=1 Tax=Novosphingobium hassiacum TaxID=173676 RepID=A0A7W5ZWI5_9SPHN|nr:glycosyltransferase [Novosphingobium hassiacum]MBB3860413.1 glycosyltransferase involved in cell wall biosynthesis [Novosphingobium hassiacum]